MMGIKDFLITPFYLILISVVAYLLRPIFSSRSTRKYFLPALWVKFLGAIALGAIYQFYYDGGDTFNYFTHGSVHIWDALNEKFSDGVSLLLNPGGEHPDDSSFIYSSQIWYFRDVKSYLIVRITAFLDIFTLHTYTATALFFAAFSFSGLWAMYSAVHKMYPNSRKLHWAILFIPSVVFWGSGILKDTVTLGALGWLTWAFLNFAVFRTHRFVAIFIGVLSALLILRIKPYILLCFAPVIFLFFYFNYLKRIKNTAIKMLAAPLILVIFGALGVAATFYASTGEYNIGNVAERAAVTSYDIKYGWGARTGGDGTYDLGALDGSWQSMVKLAPSAIIVSLIRPFIWEVRNPLMLLSALESTLFIILLFQLVARKKLGSQLKDPFMIFCLVFTVLFAFAVGISTGNFGTLMRYKIPMLPFFATFLLRSR
ncbi:MAG: hypothetical protein AAF616_14540 [Bacteroidota bacterium]